MPDHLQFPAPLPWNGRAGAMLYLPGSGIEAVSNLRALLTLLARVSHVTETIAWPTPDSTTPVREVLHTLGPCGLYRVVGRNAVELTEEARTWLESDDPEYLAAILHSRIKFFGELLALVAARPMSHEELRVIAMEKYGCDWTSLDPLRRRTTWLRSLGLADLSFDNSIHATESGIQFLPRIEVETPESIARRLSPVDDLAGIEIPEPGPSILELIAGANSEVLRRRKLALSYIPKSPKGSAIDGLRSLVQHFVPRSSRKEYRQYCGSMFGISESSADAALTTLRALSLVEPISRTELSATLVAREWLASNTDLDLIRIAHCSVSFFGEILVEIEDHPTAPALANIAHTEYGMPRLDISGMRTRLQLLRESGLLIEVDHSRHRLTSLGRDFLETIPTSEPTGELESDSDDALSDSDIPTRQDVGTVAAALIDASTNTGDPLSFEIAIADTFQALGIDAKRLGGSGDTDVLLKFVIDPLTVKYVIIEAKTSTKAVTEDSINFEVLNDHMKQHKAAHAAVVAPRFSGERLQRWARDRNVVLLEASYLSDLVLRNSEAPLAPFELIQLFTQDGRRIIDTLQSEADHRRKRVASVLSAVHAEMQNPDPEFNGSLNHREVYMALRHGPIAITSQEVQEALNFLSSPIIHSIGNNKDHFHALERPTVTATRLRAIADAIEESGFDPV